ncbi:MAG: hypothetical protein HY706_02050, partial [Candidatus Hydrogenedentes bacterium]|nr:hypothetical protein [Candidatus Hydrogenedentota bacterium]
SLDGATNIDLAADVLILGDGDTIVLLTGGDVAGDFNLRIDAGAGAVTLNDGAAETININNLTVISTGQTNIAGLITTDEGMSFADATNVDMTTNVTLTNTDSGTVDLTGGAVDGADFTLTINANATNVALDNVGQNAALSTIDINATRTTTLTGDITTNNASVLFDGATNVVLGADVAISTGAGAGNIDFAAGGGTNSLSGSFDLNLTAGTGNVELDNAAGVASVTVVSSSITDFAGLFNTTGNLAITAADTISVDAAGRINAGGTVTLTANSAAGAALITLDGSVNAVGAITLDADSGDDNATVDVNADVTAGGLLTIDADTTDAGDVALVDIDADLAGNLTITSGDNVNIDGDVTADGSNPITITADTDADGTGNVTIGAAAESTVSSVNGAIAITGENVTIGGTVGQVSTLGTGTITINADAENDNADGDIVIAAGGRISGGAAVNLGQTTEPVNLTIGGNGIQSAGDITADARNIDVTAAIQSSAGAVNLQATVDDVDIDAAISAGTTITLTADTDDITVDGALSAVTGVTIAANAAGGTVSLGAAGDISNSSGTVQVQSVGAGGAITMADGAVMNAGTGTIDLDADQNIALGGLLTSNNTIAAVDVNSANGAITDAGDTDVEITIVSINGRATLTAEDGIGSGNALETAIPNLAATNTDTNNIEIDNTGDLDVQGAGVAINAGGGNIVINVASDLTVSAPVTTTAAGAITLTATDSIVFLAAGDVTAPGAGAVTITANSGGAQGEGGAIVMADGTVVNAGTGVIDLDADDDIVLGSITTVGAAITIDSTSGGVVDGGDTNVDINAATSAVTINTITGIGANNAIETTIDSLTATNTRSGDIQILETNAITLNAITQANAINPGGISIESDTGGITVAGAISVAGTGSIDIFADGAAAGDLTVNNTVTATSGNVSLSGDDDVVFAAGGDVTTTTGNIAVTADVDDGGAASGALTMVDGTAFNAGSGTITLAADESITLGGLTTTNGTDSAVAIISAEGDLLDGGDTDTDIIADSAGAGVTIRTVTGIGSANAIETQVNSLDMVNATSGNIVVTELAAGGNLDISRASQETAGNITIITDDGTLTVVEDEGGVSVAGAANTITLTANDAGASNDDDLAINAAVTAVNGQVTLTSQTNDVNFGVGGDVTTASGIIQVNANGTGGLITMADGAILDAGDDQIDLNADSDITLGSLTTTNAADNAITITSVTGAIVDGGDTDVDIVANSAGAIVDIDAVLGVGNGNEIETTIAAVEVNNATAGNIELNETDGLLIRNITQATAGSISVTTAGATTVVAALAGVTAAGAGDTITIDVFGDASLTISSVVTSNAGAIALLADNDVLLDNAGSDITSAGGNIIVVADADEDANGAGGAITMVDLSVINAAGGTITLSADENITLGSLVSTNATAGAVSITSNNGGILDAGDTDVDIVANTAGALTTIVSANGIGVANGIETTVDTIDVQNTLAGNIDINETNAINVNRLAQVNQFNAGNIDLTTTAGTIIVVANQLGVSAEGAGNLILNAQGAGSDVDVNDTITSFTGTITLTGADAVTMSAAADITSTSGNVAITATAGVMTMADSGTDSSTIDSGTGTVTINANGTVTLGGLISANNTAAAVTVTSTTGSIVEAGDVQREITITSADGRAVLTAAAAAQTIGTTANALETAIPELDATAGDDISIFNTGNLEITGAGVDSTTGQIDITVASDLTVNSPITTTGDDINLLASENIILAAAGDVTSNAAGNITITANNGGQPGEAGAVFMADGNVVNAGTGAITINADEDITIGSVTTVGGLITITTVRGGVIDGGDTNVDINAATSAVTITAVTGIGDGDDIETTIASLTATNNLSGNITIDETDGITINGLTQVDDGDIALNAGDTITIQGLGITASGDGAVAVTMDGAGASNIVVNANITTLGSTGAVTLLNQGAAGSQVDVNSPVLAGGTIAATAPNVIIDDTLTTTTLGTASIDLQGTTNLDINANLSSAGSVDLDSDASDITLAADIQAVGDVDVNDALEIDAANVSIESDLFDVTFDADVSADVNTRNLTVEALDGTVTFSATVGGGVNPGSLTASAENIRLAANVSVDGAVALTGEVFLTGNVTINTSAAAAGGTVTVIGNVTGDQNFDITAATFAVDIDGIDTNSLDIDTTGTLTLGGDIFADDDISLDGATDIVLLTDVLMLGDGSTIVDLSGNSVQGDFDLEIDAGNGAVTLNDVVDGLINLNSIKVTSTGQTNVAGTITTDEGQDFGNATNVDLTTNLTLNNTDSGTIDLTGGAVDAAGFSLTVNANATNVALANVGQSAATFGVIDVNATGTTTLTGNITTNNANVLFDGASNVVLGADVIINTGAGAGNIDFLGVAGDTTVLSGVFNLTLTAGTGNVEFDNISQLSSLVVGSSTNTVFGGTTNMSGAIDVTASTLIDVNGDTTTTGAVTFDSSNDISVDAGLTAAGVIDMTATDDININADISGGDDLTLTADGVDGDITINTDEVTAAGDGSLDATDDLTVDLLTWSNGGDLDLTSGGSTAVDVTDLWSVGGDLSVDAGTTAILGAGGIGTIVVGQDFDLTAADAVAVTVDNRVETGGRLTLNSDDDTVDFTAGSTDIGAFFDITADGDVTLIVDNRLETGGDLSIENSGAVDVTAETLDVGEDFGIDADDDITIDVDDRIATGAGMDLVSNGGNIDLTADTVDVGEVISMEADGDVTILVDDLFSSGAFTTIEAVNGLVDFEANSVDVRDFMDITADESVAVDVEDLWFVGGGLSIDAGTDAILGDDDSLGSVFVGGDMTVLANGAITVDISVMLEVKDDATFGAEDFDADTIDFTADSVEVGEDLDFFAENDITVDVTGRMAVGTDLTVESSDASIFLDSGSMEIGEDVSLTADNGDIDLNINSSSMHVQGDFDLTADGDVTVTVENVFGVEGDASITSDDSTVDFDANTVDVKGDLDIDAELNLTMDIARQFGVEGDVDLESFSGAIDFEAQSVDVGAGIDTFDVIADGNITMDTESEFEVSGDVFIDSDTGAVSFFATTVDIGGILEVEAELAVDFEVDNRLTTGGETDITSETDSVNADIGSVDIGEDLLIAADVDISLVIRDGGNIDADFDLFADTGSIIAEIDNLTVRDDVTMDAGTDIDLDIFDGMVVGSDVDITADDDVDIDGDITLDSFGDFNVTADDDDDDVGDISIALDDSSSITTVDGDVNLDGQNVFLGSDIGDAIINTLGVGSVDIVADEDFTMIGVLSRIAAGGPVSATTNDGTITIGGLGIVAGGDITLDATDGDVLVPDDTAAIVSQAGNIEVIADAGNAEFNANVIANGLDGDGSIDMSGVDGDIQIDRNLSFTSRGTINLRSDEAAGRLVGDAGDGTETLFLDTGDVAPGASGAFDGGDIRLGNVGGDDQFVNLVLGTNVDNDDVRLSGDMQFDGTTPVASLDARNAGQIVLETNVAGNTNTTIITNGGHILFTGTPINAANPGIQTLTLNSGNGIIDLDLVGSNKFVGDPADRIIEIPGKPLGALDITAGLLRVNADIRTDNVVGGGGGDITVVAANGIKLENDALILSDGNRDGVGGDIDLDQADINGARNLRIASGDGNINLRDVGQGTRLSSLRVDSTGITTLVASEISASGDVDFSRANNVDLTGDLTVDSIDGNILFTGGAVDGAVDVTFEALNGLVALGDFGQSNETPFTSLTIDSRDTDFRGNGAVTGDVTLRSSETIDTFGVIEVSDAGDIVIRVADAVNGRFALFGGAGFLTDGGDINIRVPFNNLKTRGNLFGRQSGFEFFNLLGLTSFDFDAEEAFIGLLTDMQVNAFGLFPVLQTPLIDAKSQWKDTILPGSAIKAEESEIIFEDEEDGWK